MEAPSLCTVVWVVHGTEVQGDDDANNMHSSRAKCQTRRLRTLRAPAHETF